MPKKAKRPCRYPGCPELVEVGESYCEKHRQKNRSDYEAHHRDKERHRLYGARWQKAREGFLRKHPLCAECQRRGILTEATVVDHIKPHKGDRALFWDRSNWQPLCKSCHDAKTMREVNPTLR